MDIRLYKLQGNISSFMLSMLLIISSSVLLSCEQNPQSMFEQQASANSDEDKSRNSKSEPSPINQEDIGSLSSREERLNPATLTNNMLQIHEKKAIAQQSNCDPSLQSCQYLELNFLEFTPEQPWLNSIMWQSIARMLAPEMPLASHDEDAKRTVLMLLNQIEYSEKIVSSLPLYQRIDIELMVNAPYKKPAADSQGTRQAISNQLDSDKEVSEEEVREDKDVSNISNNAITSGYLIVRSKQHSRGSRQQLRYAMLDMDKKLQLTIEDILLPNVSNDDVLRAFASSKKQWLTSQGIEKKYHEDWPLPISSQWYLNEQGLHMVYQAGELLTSKNDSADLIAPYSLLQGLVKPRYVVP